jgi:hypothetical protein
MEEAFNGLKRKFTKALILTTYNLKEDSIVETNTLDNAIDRCLS